ncbi:MAG: SPFH domain-containing protein [Planctomycetia bacterium]|nr:MAG: SPFH domain-containing protein [Planctomycetia bacterium]
MTLPTFLAIETASIWGFVRGVIAAKQQSGAVEVTTIATIVAMAIVAVVVFVLLLGHFTLQPNQAAVLLLFGKYKGTARDDGFHWANPFLTKTKVSLRSRNLNTDKLKVNDSRGNPIEIGTVVVWHVANTAQACFDVDDYTHYVAIQSEAAVRHLASSYPYDSGHDHEVSLRGATNEVNRALQAELQERLNKAGVVVEEARLSHLAYAPEIAGVMLRRQQAEAVVSARMRIVEGACGMVEAALERLSASKMVELDAERKAAMVSNLLVVLCGEQGAQPVVNAGTLYS